MDFKPSDSPFFFLRRIQNVPGVLPDNFLMLGLLKNLRALRIQIPPGSKRIFRVPIPSCFQ